MSSAPEVSAVDLPEVPVTNVLITKRPWLELKAQRTLPTLRISLISKNITPEKLLEDLKISSTDENILGFSFAPHPVSTYAEKYSVATYTFRDIPINFQENTESKLRTGDTVFVDHDFFGLTPLSNPIEEITVDIIAVTGLGGHAFGSWRSRDGLRQMWLRNYLPAAVPSARILVYGYDTKLLDNESNASLLEFSKDFLETIKTARSHDKEKHRPIIFIGHSLGGLVIKKALAEAAQGDLDAEDRAVFCSCYGILFFGVPNTGLHISSLRSMVKGQQNAQLIEDLRDSSHILQELTNSFSRHFTPKLADSRILSFYETKLTSTVKWSSSTKVWERAGGKVMMVNYASAIQGGNPEDHYSLHRDHSALVKFSRNDQDYLIVERKIQKLAGDAPAVIGKRFQPQRPISRKELSEIQIKCRNSLKASEYSIFRERYIRKKK